MDILKLELFGDNIWVNYVDGSREEIEGGIYESKDPNGDKLAKRIATSADIARLKSLAADYEASIIPLDAVVVRKQVVGTFIEITYDDGRKEKIGAEGYEIKDADNNTIFQRPATAADQARLADLDVGETGGGIPGTGGPIELVGTAGDDRLDGTDAADAIQSLGGDDRIRARGGNDSADGGDGNDQVRGDLGDDTVMGGAGDDLVRGDEGNDTVYGGVGNDRARGMDGDDLVYGDDGNDRADGGIGNDTVYGGNGDDRVKGDAGDDIVSGDAGNDSVNGDLGNDMVLGGAGDDTVKGDAGNDTLDGGTGIDIYDGGLGEDVLVFGVDGAFDRVKGFEDGIDLIDISAFGLTGVADLTLTQSGQHLFIDLGGGDVIRLDNMSVAQVTDADFIF